jgi:hypothetical protein
MPCLPNSSESLSMNMNFNLMGGSRLLDQQPVPVESHMPAQDRWVLVFTPTYRCLGYQEGGVWRDVMHGRRINDRVLSWMPVEDRAAG